MKPVAFLVEPNHLAHHTARTELTFERPIDRTDYIITPLYRLEDTTRRYRGYKQDLWEQQ